MILPLLISVPHGGVTVPDELKDNCLLSHPQIIKDGDEFSHEIYASLENEVVSFVSTDIARAVLDMNRAEGDIRKDGVVKTHTCWDEPIWKRPLSAREEQWLINSYHRPYHQRLTELAKHPSRLLAIDCHTMAAFGPPVGPDPDEERPQVCLGNINGESCPEEWLTIMCDAFQKHFPGEVRVNQPFAGGYITQFHGKEMPWIQLELSRGAFATPMKKSVWMMASLKDTVKQIEKI